MERLKTSWSARRAGFTTHMGDAGIKAHSGHDHTIFGDEAFAYDRVANIYRCPAGQILRPRRMHPVRRTIEYKAPARVCAGCACCALNVLALPMDALCKDTKNKRP